MTLDAALDHLRSRAHDSTQAHNEKWGAGERQIGVRKGDIRALAKTLRTDHDLALGLWETGIFDAQLLAILVLDPKRLTDDDVDRLVRSARDAQVADWLNAYVVKNHPGRDALRVRWLDDADPWAARAGWSLTAGRVARAAEGLDLGALLDRIEAEMPGAPPPTQWTMNTCLATVGIHHPEHRDRALVLGETLGIYRDYPVSKGCTSPFAPIWIREMVRRQG